VKVLLVIVSFVLSAHLLVITSYNLIQLSAEELVEKSSFEELKEKELNPVMNFIFLQAPDVTVAIVFSSANLSFHANLPYFGVEREIPIPPPDFGNFFS
jgi:hypothetical protein